MDADALVQTCRQAIDTADDYDALEAAEKTWQASTDPLDRISARIIRGAVYTLTGKVREGAELLSGASAITL